MSTKTKKEIVNEIALTSGIHPQNVRQVIQEFLQSVTNHLSNGNRLEFRDFGVFEVVTRKQKIGRNPKNAAISIVIPSRQAVKFTPGKKMKQQLANNEKNNTVSV